MFRAGDLKLARHGLKLRVASHVIARQRPGTAHGFIFLSLEDETGIANAVVEPDLYEANRSLVTYTKFLLIEAIASWPSRFAFYARAACMRRSTS